MKLYKYGKKVSVYDTDSTKYDAIKTGEKTCGTTPKQALAALRQFAEGVELSENEKNMDFLNL